MPKVLRDLTVNEVSLVDAAANSGCKITLRKRRDDNDDLMLVQKDGQRYWVHPLTFERNLRCDGYKPVEAPRGTRTGKTHDEIMHGPRVGKTFKQALAELERGDEAVDDVEQDDDDDDEDDDNAISNDLLDKVVQMFEGKLSRAEALQFICGNPVGRELHRSHVRGNGGVHKGDTMITEAVVKEFTAKRLAELDALGPVAVAKAVVKHGADLKVDEHQFVGLVTKSAQKQHPNLSAASAFSKMFAAPTEDGVLLRKAHKLVKEMATLTPMVSGGLDEQRDVISNTEQSEAYRQLQEFAEKQRATAPWLSSAQAFERAFKANPELARKAHQRPTAPANGFYEFPR
jgi:hypothetical protein